MKTMKQVMMFGTGVLLLSSCSMMGMGMKDSSKMNAAAPSGTTNVNTPVMQGTASYVLGRQPGVTTITPMGNVAVSMSGTTIMTSAKLTGMAPDTYYVAHYHNMGTGSTTDPCASGGMALMSSKIVGMSNKDGMLTLTGSVAKSEILQATYFNVHTAKDAEGTPADAGVACSAVKIQ